MNTIIALEVVGVLAAWLTAGYAIWKWGPGLRKRSVRCPDTERRAVVLAEQREAEFGCLRAVEVRACSLIPAEVLSCGKACLSRL